MAASQLKTNRDLYLFICGLRDVSAYRDRDLEQYLRALWQLGTMHNTEESLSLGRFAELLEAAFRESAPVFDPAWRDIADAYQAKLAELIESVLRESATEFDASAWRDIADAGFAGWQDTILWQIVDLRDMDKAGMLRNEQRYFGIDAPRGNRWYNFDPMTYLECAAAGTFGGFHAGDPGGRMKFDSTTPDDPTVEIPLVGWDGFTHFLRAGAFYE